MHYYKRNLGDYAKKAGRLSILQHGVYNLLIDACYDRERFPTRDEAVDWVWACSQDEIEAVDFVLRKFFTPQDDGTWVQSRIQDEIADYQQFCVDQAEKGRRGGRRKKARVTAEKKPDGFPNKADGFPVGSNKNPDESRWGQIKTLTTNHKPITNKNNNTSFDYSSWPSMPDSQILTDWFAMRKRIKADVSQTVINNFGRELAKAAAAGHTVDDCLSEAVTRNWRGFKLEWMSNAQNRRPGGTTPESKSERSARIAREMLQEASDRDLD